MENILDEDLGKQDLNTYYEAPSGRRFVNFIIDFIIVYIIKFIIGILIGIATLFVYIDVSLVFIAYLFGLPTYVLYYTLMEFFANGKTIGKLITRTRAVRIDGQKLTFTQAFGRSISRLIPIDPVSAIISDRPWHDSIPKTMVISDK